MTNDYINWDELKAAYFEVFSVGYEAGYSGEDELATAYDKWFKKFLEAWRAYNERFL